MNDKPEYVVVALLLFALTVALYISTTTRIDNLEKQVNTLGIAVKSAHGEAKQAQRMQGPYLPDPMKVVEK